jgi:hypothetical protein
MPCDRKSLSVRRRGRTGAVVAFVALAMLVLGSRLAYADAAADARAEAYRKFSGQVNAQNLRQTVDTLAGFGSRVAGYPGNAKAADYVEQQFRTLGLSSIQVDEFNVTVPIDPSVEDPNRSATITVQGESVTGKSLPYKMYPLWPNLVRTSMLPKEGLTGPLIYVRDGKIRNFNGKDVDGAIVLVDFNCASEWLNAPRLGAKAVIFVAPDNTMRGEAEAKFISIPIKIPRFYITQREAAPLLATCTGKRPPKVTLRCDMPWQNRKAKNFSGWIQGTDPAYKDQIIVVQAYYDSISVVPALAPGAESACGIAGMFELIRSFKANPPKRSMLFVATSAHYQALRGVREYVEKHIEEWQPAGWFQKKATPVKNIYLWVGLDLASQTRSFGVFYKGWFYDYREDIQGRFSDIARVCRENAEKVGNVLGFNYKRYFNDGVNPVDGKNWRNFISGRPAFDSEVVSMAGGNGITFASTDDSRTLVDTPFDTPEKVNIANLAQQVKLINCLMWHIVTDTNAPGDSKMQRMPITDPSKWSRMALQGGFSTLQGRVQLFNPRKSFIANSDERLRSSLVVVRSKNKSFMGVRGNMIQATEGDENFYEFHGVAPLTAYGTNRPATLSAYHVDERGEIDYAPDLGVSGAKVAPLDVLVTTAVKETPIIVFRCVATAVYDLVDQQSLRALNGIEVYEGKSNGEPRMFGYAIDPLDPTLVGSYVEDVAVIFAEPGTRLKLAMSNGPANIRLLLINSQYDSADPFNNKKDENFAPEGIGYLVSGSVKDQQHAEMMGSVEEKSSGGNEEIARSGAIYDTALHVAEDMWKLDDYRMQRLAKYRIMDMNSDEGVPGLHNRARKALDLAKQARAAKDWEKFDAYSREAWGLESRAYPDVQRTAMDVVQGVLFYLALLLPFAYFIERLVWGFYDLKRQLLVAAAIFFTIFLVFQQIHPAFEITMNPIIVLLAFVMLALSVIVIGMIGGKFEEQIKEMNQGSGIHKADIGRVSVAVAAFNLGISNMRRRKARTFLTCATLVLLTFTVLSFTSVVQTMRFNQVPAPSDRGPRYNGIMIRTAMWEQLQEPAYRLLADEFGREHAVAPRAWFFGTQMGEQSFLTLKRADRQYDAKALCGLSEAEATLTRLQEALVTDEKGKPIGRWFQPGDVYTILIPDAIANALKIEPADVGKAKLIYSGVEYTVIGILDSQKLKELADLDNEILTPVDFIAMNKTNRGGGSGGGQGFKEYTHLEPDMVFFIPYQTAVNLGAELRSIAIDFGDPKVVMERLNPLMHRLGLNLYAGRIEDADATDPVKRGTIERFSSIAATSSRGMEMIFFPILIASLIVLNTMLGSVFERVREIHIFSSIGLAPTHIGMLFIAEALVYAVFGSVAGYLLGQATSKLLVFTHWLPDLYLNFSSVSAVLTTLIVVVVVLLSTLYPARKAAEVATPAADRSWRIPDPQGDHWEIPLPFAVTGDQAAGLNSFLGEWFQAYEEYSIGDFVTQGVESSEFEHEYGKAYRIGCMTWLAPFDLGVSQKVAIETLPTDTMDVFEIKLIINRESGDISNWKRVNRRFLNTLRKQFLIWRTLKQADRDRYLNPNTEGEEGTNLDMGEAQPA